MRIVHISDTHMSHHGLKMPDGDVLVHTGDFSGVTTDREIITFNTWLMSLHGKYRKIIFVPGNHDGQFEKDFQASKFLMAEAEVLVDQQLEFDGVKFYGSPWTLTFFDWWFMKDADKIKERWDLIPDDTNVLLTHQPPYMLLDRAVAFIKNKRDQDDKRKIVNVGCKELRHTCMTRLKKLKLNCFGHLHMDGGKTVEENGIIFSNGAVLDDYYSLASGPNVIDI